MAFALYFYGQEEGADDVVKVKIEVTPEAAVALKDEERRLSVGRMISELLRPRTPEDHPLKAIFAEIKRDARAAGLTDEEIDAELAAYNAERRA